MSNGNDTQEFVLTGPAPAPTWTYKGQYGPLTNPLVRVGDRLIGVAKSNVFAIDVYSDRDAKTGAGKIAGWTVDLTSLPKPQIASEPPVTGLGGAVYLMNGQDLYAFHLANGKPLKGWAVQKGIGRVSRLLARQGRVIAIHSRGRDTAVSGFDARSGTREFGPITVGQNSAQAVGYGDNAVFFAASEKPDEPVKLHARNAYRADPRWTFNGDGDTLDPVVEPLVGEKVVVAVGNLLHGVDLRYGEKKFTVRPSRGDALGFHWFAPIANIPSAAVAATRTVNLRAARPLLGDASGLRARLTAAEKEKSGTAIATNSADEIVCFSLADGKDVWRNSKITAPGAPVLIDGVVYVTIENGAKLCQLDALTGKQVGTTFDLPRLDEKSPAVIGNGALYLTHLDGSISAHSFSVRQAALFDGKAARIEVPSEDGRQPGTGRFDFGAGDFTIEAWFRSSAGGEIVSSHPTGRDQTAHGFRLNLSGEGRVRVAVLNRTGSESVIGQTAMTFASDGEWHHVAFVRRDGNYMLVLDGLSYEVRSPEGQQNRALTIGDNAALTIGAFVPASNSQPRDFFRGLIREVRLWNKAVEISVIEANRRVALTGREPRLQGLWKLDEEQVAPNFRQPRNVASKQGKEANFVNPGSCATDFSLDQTAFPYLLHEPVEQWPYAGTWGARGEDPMRGSAAISSDGVVAFATTKAIYAVRAQDGRRCWTMNTTEGASEPLADGSSFLMMLENESLVRIDARSGGKSQELAFSDMPSRGRYCVRPALSETWIAACDAGNATKVYVAERTQSKAHVIDAGGSVLQMIFGPAGLVVLSNRAGALTLSVIDPATGAKRGSRLVRGQAFCMAGNSIFAELDRGVVRLDSKNLEAVPQAVSGEISGTITGLVASETHDLVAAATGDGKVHGFWLGTLVRRWEAALPTSRGVTAGAVNQPILDDQGRVLCTTSTGTVAVLSPEDGALQGLYFTQYGALGTPVLRAGTLYTGCLPSYANDVDDEVDGALHSIILGQTVVMRLNLDKKGAILADGKQHGVVRPDPKRSTLAMVNMQNSCVEAWVNLPKNSPAGGILGITPTDQSNYGLNLWIDDKGALCYKAYDKDQRGWMCTEIRANAGLASGEWHHVAVSRERNGQRTFVYIDGKAFAAKPECNQVAPPKLSEDGLTAYLGACAGEDLQAFRPFRGMIADVRVWDAWLPATEISDRMNVKLRGDEPDLIAWWNFDEEGLHDAAHQGHDGELAEDPTVPVWWLSDLAFTEPAYPYITTAASIASEVEGKPKSYKLTIRVCAANARGLAGEPVKLWYVRKGADEPDTILINGTEVDAVSPVLERRRMLRALQNAKAYEAVTGADGSLTVTVATSVPGHAPTLDFWTQFMPDHLRFHINVLLDNQKLAKPAPPVLSAQAKLIQDYQYSPGGKIDHSRDRSTWRVILNCSEPNGVRRPREPITLWASQRTTIEIGPKSYDVNPDNAITVDAEANGELTVVLAAGELTAPTLYARAGFMHRNDRIVINPDQDAHARLADIKDSELTQSRVTNWKRAEDRKPEDNQSLLNADYAPHAPTIGNAIRSVTSSTRTSDPDKPLRAKGLTGTRRQLLEMRPMAHEHRARLLMLAENGEWKPPVLTFMEQPEKPESKDRVVTRRALAGMSRPAPVDPGAFRAAMGGNVGFVFAGGRQKGTFSYKVLKTEEEAKAERGVPTPEVHAPQVGGIFDTLWDGIKDVATTIYDTATKIVVTIADQVRIAVTKLVDTVEKVYHTVVETVKDALDAVAGFFEQIAVAIKKVIEFLRALFDWGNILKTHDILFEIFKTSFDLSSGSLKNMATFLRMMDSFKGLDASSVKGGKSLGQQGTREEGSDSAVASGANSVQGKSMIDRANNSPARMSSQSDAKSPDADGIDAMDIFLKGVPELAHSVLDLAPGDLVRKLLDLMKRAAMESMGQTARTIAELSAEMVGLIQWISDALKAKIDIPFISELYKWITGRDLSLLSVFCLALAIPVNLAYALVTSVLGRPGFFFDEAAWIPQMMRNTAKQIESGSALLLASAPGDPLPGTPRGPEILLIAAKCVIKIADELIDIEFAMAVGNPNEAMPQLSGIMGIVRGLFGMAQLSLETFCCQTGFTARVHKVVGDKVTDFVPKWIEMTYTLYGIQMALCAKKIYSGIQTLRGVGSSEWLDRLKGRYELKLTAGISLAAAGHMGYQIWELSTRLPELQAYGNEVVAKEYELLAIRNILSTTPLLFEWMFTVGGIEKMRAFSPAAPGAPYAPAVGVRHFSDLAAIIVHGIAIFNYGGAE